MADNIEYENGKYEITSRRVMTCRHMADNIKYESKKKWKYEITSRRNMTCRHMAENMNPLSFLLRLQKLTCHPGEHVSF